MTKIYNVSPPVLVQFRYFSNAIHSAQCTSRSTYPPLARKLFVAVEYTLRVGWKITKPKGRRHAAQVLMGNIDRLEDAQTDEFGTRLRLTDPI